MFSYGFPQALPDSGCVTGLVPHCSCICLYTRGTGTGSYAFMGTHLPVNADDYKQFSAMWDFLNAVILVSPILYERHVQP